MNSIRSSSTCGCCWKTSPRWWRPEAQQKGLEICCDLPADLPTLMKGDADRLRQVVLNLVSNAVKFTQKGQVIIHAAIQAANPEELLVRFEVEDTGLGIPDDRRDRLFKLFSQVDASTTRRFGGTGLGLALCKRLVELFGGEIGVASAPGKGSTFWFTAHLQTAQDHADSEVVPSNLHQLRVLVVDDNATNLEIASTHLRRWGILCEVSDYAPSALVELKNACQEGRPYGLAILDMQMPDMDGRELISQVRGTPEIADLPLIMLTSIGEDISPAEKDSWRLAEYLNKPIRQSRLFDAVVSATCEERSVSPTLLCGANEPIHATSPGFGYQVLVAEDNDINQVVIREMLTRLGFACTLVGNGQQALEQAASRAFDLVLLDCQMPILDGFGAASAIRLREPGDGGWARRGGQLPIIALTANAVAGDRELCLAAGMDDYLTKPIDRKILVATLAQWLAAERPLVAELPPAALAAPSAVGVVPSEPCFDREEFLGRCFDDCQMAVELLDMFADRAGSNLPEIDEAIAQRDRGRLLRIAHALKGVAGNLSAEALHKLATKIDHEYRDATSDIDALLSDVRCLRDEVQRCLVAVPPLRQSLADQVSSTPTR